MLNVEDLNKLRSTLHNSGITWIGRDGNQVARSIATLACDGHVTGSWFRNPPDLLRKALLRNSQAL